MLLFKEKTTAEVFVSSEVEHRSDPTTRGANVITSQILHIEARTINEETALIWGSLCDTVIALPTSKKT